MENNSNEGIEKTDSLQDEFTDTKEMDIKEDLKDALDINIENVENVETVENIELKAHVNDEFNTTKPYGFNTTKEMDIPEDLNYDKYTNDEKVQSESELNPVESSNPEKKEIYSYTDSPTDSQSTDVQNNYYNYNNSGSNFYNNIPNNSNQNFKRYEYSASQDYNYNSDVSSFKKGNKSVGRFVVLISACVVIGIVLLSFALVSIYNIFKNTTLRGASSNNNRTYSNKTSISPANDVNYDNFLKINANSTLDDVKNLLKVKPVSNKIDALTQYVFDEFITVTYDENGVLVDKIIESDGVSFPSSSEKIDFKKFQNLEPNMSLSETEEVLGSKGLLTEITYRTIEGYYFAGDSYTWPIEKGILPNPYLICDFDSENRLIRAKGYGGGTNLNPKDDLKKEDVEKFNNIPMGVSIDEVKSSLSADLVMESIGVPDNYMSKYYFAYKDANVGIAFDKDQKLVAKWISSRDYMFFDINAEDSNNINKIKNGMSYDEIKDMLGSEGHLSYEDAIESKDYKVSSKSYIWIFEDNSLIEVNFDFSSPEGKVTSIEQF